MSLSILEDGTVTYNTVAACAYCTDPNYNVEAYCENYGDDGSGSATWIIDTNSDEIACLELNGTWMDGAIGGFQFFVDGVSLNGSSAASGGHAGDASFTMNTNPDNGMVLGFSLTGATFGPSCGTMVELDIIEGIPTGLSDLIIADAAGAQLPFSYYDDSIISGCMDDLACNYNTDATEDDGSCSYAEENYDCDGNCTAGIDYAGECNGVAVLDMCNTCDNDSSNDCVQDCAGVWGGDSIFDECFVCGGTGIPDGACDCAGNVEDECGVCGGGGAVDGVCPDDGMPLQFMYNQSIAQAFYYFQNVTLNGSPVDASDWVGAFNGETCVGSRQWDTSQCGGGICDLPAMGDTGDDITDGYMTQGVIPSFKIYDASEQTYHDALASGTVNLNQGNCIGNAPECMGWVTFGIVFIDNLQNVIEGCMDTSACNYNSLANVDNGSCYPADCSGTCDGTAVIDSCLVCSGGNTGHDADSDKDCTGDCFGSATFDNCGECSGGTSGHTANSDEDCNGDCFGSATFDSCGVCSGGNSAHTADSNKDCAGDCFGSAVLDNCGACDDDSSNDCTQDCEETWGGNAMVDNCGTCDIDLSNDCIPDCSDESQDCDGIWSSGQCWGGTAVVDVCGICGGDGTTCDTPSAFEWNQSTQQAFYYFYNVSIEMNDGTNEPIASDDWVGAFKGDICVGSRLWDTSLCNSGVCDLPVMGDDSWMEDSYGT